MYMGSEFPGVSIGTLAVRFNLQPIELSQEVDNTARVYVTQRGVLVTIARICIEELIWVAINSIGYCIWFTIAQKSVLNEQYLEWLYF